MMNYEMQPKPVLFSGLLADFPKEVRREAFEGIDVISSASLLRIKKLTPGKDLPNGWRVNKKGGKTYRIRELFNSDERAYKPVALKSGKTTNLLEMMEYGTRPHEIVPVNAKALVFKVDGRLVRTKHVDHPGTRPYGFTAQTYGEALRMIGQLQARLVSSLSKFGSK